MTKQQFCDYLKENLKFKTSMVRVDLLTIKEIFGKNETAIYEGYEIFAETKAGRKPTEKTNQLNDFCNKNGFNYDFLLHINCYDFYLA